MLEIEKFIEETKLKNEIEINIITPIFFKIGNEFVVSSEPLYTFKNLIKKIKISSLKDNKIIFELLKNFDIKKIKIKENSTKNIFLKEYNSYGMTGKIVFEIENYTENELILFNFLIYFSFFSSIGYATEKGYGQINIKI